MGQGGRLTCLQDPNDKINHNRRNRNGYRSAKMNLDRGVLGIARQTRPPDRRIRRVSLLGALTLD